MIKNSILREFIELAMNCYTEQTRDKYNLLISKPITPVTIVFIAHLREDYNNFMTDCTAMLHAEELLNQTQLN
ncbi:MAG: hypothetical protein JXR61_03185 [Prolixibacteraceae bacterium]|nr:hypothetical protein [Prolixibacteraceae bacterium]